MTTKEKIEKALEMTEAAEYELKRTNKRKYSGTIDDLFRAGGVLEQALASFDSEDGDGDPSY